MSENKGILGADGDNESGIEHESFNEHFGHRIRIILKSHYNIDMEDILLQRYSRHILLDDIGMEGQQRLNNSRALIVGAGGLGSPAAIYLSASGFGVIEIYDDDEVDLTNLQRQILHDTSSIGETKVGSAKSTLTSLNPNCEIEPHRFRFENVEDAAKAVERCDVVLDCSDNYATRHIMNRACVETKTPLVFGAASGFDGQSMLFDSRDMESPCYNCLFSEEGEAPETPCSLMGVFAPLTGVVGCLQAASAIKLIATPHLSSPGRLLLIEAKEMRIREVRVPRDPKCKVCGS